MSHADGFYDGDIVNLNDPIPQGYTFIPSSQENSHLARSIRLRTISERKQPNNQHMNFYTVLDAANKNKKVGIRAPTSIVDTVRTEYDQRATARLSGALPSTPSSQITVRSRARVHFMRHYPGCPSWDRSIIMREFSSLPGRRVGKNLEQRVHRVTKKYVRDVYTVYRAVVADYDPQTDERTREQWLVEARKACEDEVRSRLAYWRR